MLKNGVSKNSLWKKTVSVELGTNVLAMHCKGLINTLPKFTDYFINCHIVFILSKTPYGACAIVVPCSVSAFQVTTSFQIHPIGEDAFK